jgi:hypothetical protein
MTTRGTTTDAPAGVGLARRRGAAAGLPFVLALKPRKRHREPAGSLDGPVGSGPTLPPTAAGRPDTGRTQGATEAQPAPRDEDEPSTGGAIEADRGLSHGWWCFPTGPRVSSVRRRHRGRPACSDGRSAAVAAAGDARPSGGDAAAAQRAAAASPIGEPTGGRRTRPLPGRDGPERVGGAWPGRKRGLVASPPCAWPHSGRGDRSEPPEGLDQQTVRSALAPAPAGVRARAARPASPIGGTTDARPPSGGVG